MRLRETGPMLMEPEVRLRETGPVLKEPGVRLGENGLVLKEPGVRLRETCPVLKEPGLRLTETGVRSSVGLELSDSDVKKVVCNVLVVEEVNNIIWISLLRTAVTNTVLKHMFPG